MILIESGQTANFHSLQVSARKPLAHNFMINGFYVWSHSIWSSNASAIGLAPTAQNFSYLNEERGPSDQDRRNMVGINGIWNLDYYNGSSRFLRRIAQRLFDLDHCQLQQRCAIQHYYGLRQER